MRLDLDLLKNHLETIADEFKLKIIKEIGDLANSSLSVDDFQTKLDELCRDNIGKTSLEILAGMNFRLPDTVNSPETSNSSKNSPLQNELVEVQKKIDSLNERDKS